MPIGAAAGAGLVSAGVGAYGANQAAKAQNQAVGSANALQQQMFQQNQQNLSPYVQGGANAFSQLQSQTPDLTKPFDPKDLENTPGYQFTLGETLKAGQNSFAARGLGSSGAAVKGAQDRAFGLASTTYQQQLDNYMRQNQSTYNMLMGQTGVGASAAGSLATLGANTANQQSNNLIGGGNATAGGIMAGANAITGGINNTANAYLQQQMLQQYGPRGYSFGNGALGARG